MRTARPFARFYLASALPRGSSQGAAPMHTAASSIDRVPIDGHNTFRRFFRPTFSVPPCLAAQWYSRMQCCASSSLSLQPSWDADSLSEIDWDDLGFKYRETDHIFVMKCNDEGDWYQGQLEPYGDLKLSPSAGVLNYGQGIFEGLKAYRDEDGNILLFRPDENAMRMINGAERMCMPAPAVPVFIEAVKQTVIANKRWVPPIGKGALYIRPLLIGSGPVLGLAKAPEYTFLIYVAPVGNYFKEGPSPIHLKTESKYSRAVQGGAGGVKTICNYAPVLKAQLAAKQAGFSDVVYLDACERKYLEEVSSCNIFIVKGNQISTPEAVGSILPGITRMSVMELARTLGYQVEEKRVRLEELLEADEVFCTGTAVVISPVGSVTHEESRISYGNKGLGRVSRILHDTLLKIQMGKTKDSRGWVVKV